MHQQKEADHAEGHKTEIFKKIRQVDLPSSKMKQDAPNESDDECERAPAVRKPLIVRYAFIVNLVHRFPNGAIRAISGISSKVTRTASRKRG